MIESLESDDIVERGGATQSDIDDAGYWRANLRLIAVLLLIWLLVSYVPALIVEPLNQLAILTGFPLGYYMASQGSLVVFVALVIYYAWRLDRLDRRYAAARPDVHREGAGHVDR